MNIKNMKMMFLNSDQGGGSGGEGTQTSGQEGTESLLGKTGTSGKPTETTQSASNPWINDKGEFTEGWLDRLPDDMKESRATLAKFKDLNGLLKSNASLEKILGKKGEAVMIPGPDASPEEKSAFYKRMGLPEKADAYKAKPGNIPDGFEWDEARATEFNSLAHSLGILPSQTEPLMEKFAELEVQRDKEIRDAQEKPFLEAHKALTEAWKENFATNEAAMKRVAKSCGLPDNMREWTPDKVAKALLDVKSWVSDDKLVPIDTMATAQPGQLRAQAIMTDPANPYYAAYAGKQGPQKQKEAAALVMSLIQNG